MSEKMREILEEPYLKIDQTQWNIITIESEIVDWKRVKASDWLRVRHLYVLEIGPSCFYYDMRSVGDNLSDCCYLSHDRYVMLVFGFRSELSEIVKRCSANLLTLRIEDTIMESIDISRFKKLEKLSITGGFLENVADRRLMGLDQMSGLKYLSLNGQLEMDTLSVERMKWLEYLEIKENDCLRSITGLGMLQNLRRFSLYELPNLIVDQIPPSPELKYFQVGGCGEIESLCGMEKLRNATAFHLYETKYVSSVDVSSLPSVTHLSLSGNSDLEQIIGLEELCNLRDFDISNTAIHVIPEGIRGKKLERLDLSNLELDELPDWLPEFGLKFSIKDEFVFTSINLYGTKVEGVDMSIFEQSQDVILEWFKNRKNEDTVPLQEVKVVFLGDGEAGKTHTIARLLNDGGDPLKEDFDDKATPGIVIKDKLYEMDGKTVKVHFWDFGGQEILHSMHRMFLTDRTLYVVLLNARDDTQDDRARYWLHNIKSFAGNSPVLLVLNKIDQNPNASVNERKLRDLYAGLRRVVNLSALEDSPDQFNAALTGALMGEIRALETVGTLWPSSWAKLKTGLETMERNYITGVDYKQMCRDSGVEKNEKALLRWFNDLGVSFCYEGSRRLEHYVILRPEWITNGIYILLYNKSDETKNGVIPKRVIYEMLDPEEGNTYRRVLGGVRYDVNETEYVLEVMRKFRLSYPVSQEEEFIPALCQRDSMPIAKEYADDPDALEFRMSYDYLPDNVIHRLMVEMRSDLQLSDVWRTGALFRQHGTGLSAVVESEGELLRIFVRSDNDLHRPNTYLCILKENIDRINRDMKLAAPFAEVVYKTDRGSECFDYQDLLDSLEDGEETCRSKLLRRHIPIQDILNQTGREAELELERLRENIITACMQLQGNMMFLGSTEDQRNTYLRDALRNRGYLVNDQSFLGVGRSGRGYGEVDLELRLNADIPWTILEALRIRDGKKGDWNYHLKKLLDNYNPSGLNHLFLLTYVDCGKDAFEGILSGFSEHIRWHDEGDYARMSGTFTHLPLRRHGDPAGLRVMRCTYDRAGAPTTVTHIFVRMGE